MGCLLVFYVLVMVVIFWFAYVISYSEDSPCPHLLLWVILAAIGTFLWNIRKRMNK